MKNTIGLWILIAALFLFNTINSVRITNIENAIIVNKQLDIDRTAQIIKFMQTSNTIMGRNQQLVYSVAKTQIRHTKILEELKANEKN